MIFKTNVLAIFILLSSVSSASNLDVFFDNTRHLNIKNSIELFTDSSSKAPFSEIVSSAKFNKYDLNVINLGVTPYTHWVRFRIKNDSDEEHLIIELDNSLIDKVEFYKQLSATEWDVEETGEEIKINDRKFKDQNFIFEVNIGKGESRTFYLRLESGDIIVAPLLISTPTVFINAHLKKELIFGIYVGVLLVMFLYNLFLYFTVRDKNYLYYVAYIFSVGFTQIILVGYTYKYLWPNYPSFANQSLILFAGFAGISIVLFLRNFLQLRESAPVLNKGLNFIIIGYFIAIPLRVFGYNNISYNIADLLAGIIGLYSLIIAVIVSLKGYRSGKFFLLAWTAFLVGMFVFVLRNIGVLPYNSFTSYMMPIGNAIEVILLSFALADRINILKKEKEESQLQMVDTLKENQRIIREQNVFLESKVKERTGELEASNRELKEAQSQLVNAEKMASLGQLTAGIAHEINNPINFVTSNVAPLKKDIDDILHVLERYGNATNEQDIKEIEILKKELDTDYLVNEINLLLKGIDEGANRTAEIVKGLKSFSRLNEDDLKHTNIQDGIDATLLLLNSETGKYQISIQKEYYELPEVECFPGKLNQAFMNIINNAVQVLALSGVANPTITIKTSCSNNTVTISIKDNGTGIPQKIREKIFEPFFTTKPIGVGTGLGLSIVYTIIKAHHGTICVESEEGKGAEFIITLPIDRQSSDKHHE